MTDDLRFGRREPVSGTAKSLVVFLHGYGADGADLLGLAGPLAPHLPDTAFLAPDAPEPCRVNPMGRQWFPIPWIDGSSPVEAGAAMARSVAALDAFLDARLAAEGLGPQALALVGFSQGTMMALHVALRRPQAVAGVVGFSGKLMVPERLAAEIAARPAVLLVHGDADDVVPPAEMPAAAAALKAAGVAVETHVSAGTGHGIAPDGLALAMAFLRARLPGGQGGQ